MRAPPALVETMLPKAQLRPAARTIRMPLSVASAEWLKAQIVTMPASPSASAMLKHAASAAASSSSGLLPVPFSKRELKL